MVTNMEKYAVVVTASILQIGIIWNICCGSILLIPIYATMFFCRWKIHSFLEKTEFVQSSNTKLTIKRLVKALTVQSLVPTLTILPPAIAYLMIQFGVLGPQLFSFFIAPCLCVGPIVDPIVTTYYVTPYRRFITSALLPMYIQSTASNTHQGISQNTTKKRVPNGERHHHITTVAKK
ncbi:hypothetical protein NECAME_02239 [Necator americanus]|uniref:7TM chemoreceptor n=1 Tax=Necator americanus TaxID=51031 RepID=W2TFM6_NECAM|nr:hypothetical protein NECAME_02239 [Necator americanus]ETN80840.1 hypothetical protein NECAME_02239 [Necator americanus]